MTEGIACLALRPRRTQGFSSLFDLRTLRSSCPQALLSSLKLAEREGLTTLRSPSQAATAFTAGPSSAPLRTARQGRRRP